MKTRVILTLCIVFVIGLRSSISWAQLVAGSPEDRAYTQITAENDLDRKMTLLMDFEGQFPESSVLPDIYVMMMDVYAQKNDTENQTEIGEKIISIDADNVTALMAVARNYSLERQNLDRAVQYAQRAVDTIDMMKTQSPPSQYTEEQWRQYVDSTEQAARSILAYARSLQP